MLLDELLPPEAASPEVKLGIIKGDEGETQGHIDIWPVIPNLMDLQWPVAAMGGVNEPVQGSEVAKRGKAEVRALAFIPSEGTEGGGLASDIEGGHPRLKDTAAAFGVACGAVGGGMLYLCHVTEGSCGG